MLLTVLCSGSSDVFQYGILLIHVMSKFDELFGFCFNMRVGRRDQAAELTG